MYTFGLTFQKIITNGDILSSHWRGVNFFVFAYIIFSAETNGKKNSVSKTYWEKNVPLWISLTKVENSNNAY